MNIFRRFFLAVLILAGMAAAADAQNFKKYGYKVKDLVPTGWTFSESRGDLNRDGSADLLIMATPYDESKAFFDDDGIWVDNNLPLVAVYWRSESGYRLHKVYNVFESREGSVFSAEITPRGTIRLQAVAQSDGRTVTDVMVFRWQNGDFFRIGRSGEISVPGGNSTLVSVNYSTRKVQTVITDPSGAEQESWEDLPDSDVICRMGDSAQ